MLLDLGPHLVDQAVQLFGPPRVGLRARSTRGGRAPQVDDDVFIALEHAGGERLAPVDERGRAAARTALPRERARGRASRATDLDPQEEQLRGGMTPGDRGFGEGPPGRTSARRRSSWSAAATQAFYEGVRDWAEDGAPPPVDPADGRARARDARVRPARRRGRARCSPRRGPSSAPAAAPPRTSYPSSPHPGRRPLLPPGRDPADVAQLVEHFTRNEGVPGSSPGVGLGRSPCKPCTRYR